MAFGFEQMLLNLGLWYPEVLLPLLLNIRDDVLRAPISPNFLLLRDEEYVKKVGGLMTTVDGDVDDCTTEIFILVETPEPSVLLPESKLAADLRADIVGFSALPEFPCIGVSTCRVLD